MKNRLVPILLLIFCAIQTAFSAASDIDIIKKRVIESIMNREVDDNRVEKLVNTIQADGTWPDINYLDVSREGFENRIHNDNMVQMARAYKTKSSKFYKNKKVKSAIESALQHWVEKDYICDNWHPNQIGTPTNLVYLMLIMGDELPADLVEKAQPIIGRAHLNASGARTSGDRIKIAGILAKNLLFIEDYEQFKEVLKVIEGEIVQIPWIGQNYGYGTSRMNGGLGTAGYNGRGIQFDYSFHHRVDSVNNTLSYGTGYADAFIEWADYLSGTEFAFTDEKINMLIDYYLDGICRHLIFGKYPDPGAKNRSVSREDALHAFSSGAPQKLLKTTDYRKNELREIINIRDGSAKPTLSHATFYWNTEHFTIQRPGWFTSVRMYSTRNYNMEVGYNSEGLKNHHRGDGANHISRTGDEYYDIFPVFDYQKVPGATIVQKPEMPEPGEIQKLGLTDFVGAVTDGKYGAAAFDFRSPHDPVVGRKAWFFFDEEYVCLGTGISCSVNLPVVTTINQCLLRDNVTVSVNHSEQILENGERELQNVDWIFQDGIGYVFPEPATVNLKNNTASGSWWNINKQSDSPKEILEKDVFKLWVNHGERPSNASYEYFVVPATTVEKLAQNESKNNIVILKNTPELQAVQHKKLDITEAVFYKAGEIQIAEGLKLTTDNPGIVLIKMKDGKPSEISVEDPNRELQKFHLAVSAKITATGNQFKTIWNDNEKLTEFEIDLPAGNYAGKSITINL